MALKDITLGQYFPGNTLLHRLDPRTKLLFTVAYIVALFLAKQVVSYAILFVLLAVLIAVSKVGIRSILRGMKPILIIVIITGLAQPVPERPGGKGLRWYPSGFSPSTRRASGRRCLWYCASPCSSPAPSC